MGPGYFYYPLPGVLSAYIQVCITAGEGAVAATITTGMQIETSANSEKCRLQGGQAERLDVAVCLEGSDIHEKWEPGKKTGEK